MDSYRVEERGAQRIILADQEGEIGTVPASCAESRPKGELDRLSQNLREFNDRFGVVECEDEDRVREMISETTRKRGQKTRPTGTPERIRTRKRAGGA